MNGASLATNGTNGQQKRVSYRRGDIAALIFGILLTVYALGWFGKETMERMKREQSVVPAEPAAQTSKP
jgi:hypothetical protein